MLDEVKSHTVTARGEVNISYSGCGRGYSIEIDIPAGMTAEVVFPLVAGGEFAEVYGRCGRVEFTANSQIITVGSGKRKFLYKESNYALCLHQKK